MNFLGPEIIIIFLLLFSLLSFGLTIWSIIDVARHDFVKKDNKVIWLLINIFVAPIGPIIYLTQRKKLLAKYNGGVERMDVLDLNSGRPLREERGNRTGFDDDYV